MTQGPFNPDALGLTSRPIHRRWDRDTALLYAVGVGCEPDDGLTYAVENCQTVPQQAIPTLAIVLSSPLPMFDDRPTLELWDDIGSIDWTNVVHGEQSLQMYRPLPIEGEAVSTATVTGVYDKGKGTVVVLDTDTDDAAGGGRLFKTRTSIYVRGAGGWGGERGPRTSPAPLQDSAPDYLAHMSTARNQALVYRLSGDRNPLHADPAVAAAAGFDRPILHGLCTYGFTARALLSHLCENDASRFLSMGGRFSSPVYPGDELTVSIWRAGIGRAQFDVTRDGASVIEAGTFEFQEQAAH